VKAQGATERIKDDMYSRALDKVFLLRFAILLPDREKYRGDSGMSECSVGKHVLLWLVQACQSDAHLQFRILAEQQQKTKRTNHLTLYSINAFRLQRLAQLSRQLFIGLCPIKTVSETVNKTRARPLPDIHKLNNRLRITMSHN